MRPDGCPWDREQTFDSIKRHTLEETYEVFDAIERRAWPDLKDELGDLLLQVLFYAQMASEAGYFTIARCCCQSERQAHSPPSAYLCRTWRPPTPTPFCATGSRSSARRSRPAAATQTSMLDDIPRTMPAMLEAGKLGSRAAKIGFDWPNADGLFDKLQEEIGELQAELTPPSDSQSDAR